MGFAYVGSRAQSNRGARSRAPHGDRMAAPRRHSPLTAAALSFLFPGLGEWAAGARRRALLAALPVVVAGLALGGYLAGTYASGGAVALATLFLHPSTIYAIVVLDLVALAWRVASILGAWRLARRANATGDRPRRRARVVGATGLTLLLVTTTVVQGAIAAVGVQATDVLVTVFPGDTGTGFSIPAPSFEPEATPPPTPPPSASPGDASPTPDPTPTPTAVPVPGWAQDGRLNLLLVGSDAGTGRWSLRTDTMILLSVDVASGHAAFFGIPRNLINVPLPAESARAFPGGRYPALLNSLYVYADGHPAEFPGGDARGFRAVTGAIQELVGVPLDGFVAVDLQGFVSLVDAVGGLWYRVPSPIYDDRYPLVNGTGYRIVSISAGCHHFTGDEALEYARSRHQDSDYGRMGRQQSVLIALRRQLDPLDLLTRAPDLLTLARDDLSTTLSLDDLPGIAGLASRVDPLAAKQVLIAPPEFPEVMTTAEITAIHDAVRQVFDGTWPVTKPSTGSSASCP